MSNRIKLKRRGQEVATSVWPATIGTVPCDGCGETNIVIGFERKAGGKPVNLALDEDGAHDLLHGLMHVFDAHGQVTDSQRAA